MSSAEKVIHIAPADQPKSVHELTERLFPAYTVDGGAVHLAGCRLEDRLFLRIERDSPGVSTFIVDEAGHTVEEGFAQALGMDSTVPWQRPPEMAPDLLEDTLRRSSELVREKWGVAGELNAVSIWCRYAQGKLRFTIGDHSADLPFSGWTRTLEPPPFVCPYMGIESFHIAATDDGRVAAAESIGVCAESGRRVLANELVTCDVTGRSVLADLTCICPVSQRPVLQHALVTCSMCCQKVSPSTLEADKCLACRSLRPIARTEAPLAAVLKEHENLARWSKWSMSETADVFILLATGWWKRLLVVIGKSDLSVRHAAMGKRLQGKYLPIDFRQLEKQPER